MTLLNDSGGCGLVVFAAGRLNFPVKALSDRGAVVARAWGNSVGDNV